MPVFVELVRHSTSYIDFECELVCFFQKKYRLNESDVKIIHNHVRIAEKLPYLEKKVLQDKNNIPGITHLKGYRRAGYFKSILLFSNDAKDSQYVLVDNNTLEYEIYSKTEFENKYFKTSDDHFYNIEFNINNL